MDIIRLQKYRCIFANKLYPLDIQSIKQITNKSTIDYAVTNWSID